MRLAAPLLSALLLLSVFSHSSSFQSDELINDDDEFIGLDGARSPDLDRLSTIRPSTRRRPDLDSPASSDSKAVQFSLEHAIGDSGFFPAGTFTARLKTWSHGVQTLTKLRFSRNALSDTEREAFEILLKEDDYYTIRVSSNVVNPSGKDYVVSSVKARCLPRESLDEHFIIHMDGVNILSVNYGSAGACEYPRMMKLPAKWEFNSYTVLKNSEQAPRTPIFTEELVAGEIVEGEGVKPPERSFWAKYWMYMIPLGLIIMNAVTQAMNMPEEQAAGQSAAGQPQPQQAAVQRAPNAAVRRR